MPPIAGVSVLPSLRQSPFVLFVDPLALVYFPFQQLAPVTV